MESPYVTSYWSLIVTLAVSAVFEIFTLKDRKLLIFPPLLFDAPAGGTPENFWMKFTPQKLEG